eukprot:COSAG03_NODE_12583_length_540_cov_2.909297_2_plen_30_part_01
MPTSVKRALVKQDSRARFSADGIRQRDIGS